MVMLFYYDIHVNVEGTIVKMLKVQLSEKNRSRNGEERGGFG